MKKVLKNPLFWIAAVLLLGVVIFSTVNHFRTANQNDIDPYYEGKGLCVKIVNYDGESHTEPHYNYFEIQKFDDVTLPGFYTAIFSITNIEQEYVVIEFKEPLYQGSTEVSKITVSIGDDIEVKTSTEEAGTAYTFSIEDWRYE